MSSRFEVAALSIPGPLVVRPRRFEDGRGYFAEAYTRRDFCEFGIREHFVQENRSYSILPGTFRGFHFQRPPYAQVKLVRVERGRVLDIVIDLRAGSPCFGDHIALELGAETGDQLYVPEGFAHGLLTLEAETVVAYKVSNYYAPTAEGGILWSDPALKIEWPAGQAPVVISERDAELPRLAEVATPFVFSGGEFIA